MTESNDKQKRDEEIKASFALDGIEFTAEDEKLFSEIEEKGLSVEQSIEYIKEQLLKDK